VLDCDYAKAPEFPFPAAYEDVSDVVAHVLANEEGNYDAARLSIGGFSSGATLALVVGATMPQNTFKAVTAFYPATNMNLTTHPNPPVPHGQPALSPSALRFFYSAYIPHTISRTDPRLSPHNSPPSAYPKKVLVVACEFDPLHDEDVEFGRVLKEGGKDVEVMDIRGVSHGWDNQAEEGTELGEKRAMAHNKAAEVLREAYQS